MPGTALSAPKRMHDHAGPWPRCRWLILASDGVFEYMSGAEALAVVAKHGDKVRCRSCLKLGCPALRLPLPI